ncbi:hypothetical protein GCM10008018_45260 [Paenibacillus marchantiophytorum]|uniref:Uncharacterized protein n=1 Tax=Paenibacillus marchantiophytorum TaxID=1619310 RepID=A0ABQ1EZZ8_9BACL|nr:hypothetical protein [Paenibacillus marchantiophytorum]GFZ93781.1 hypothetical protein GCM10008018_45260 [Paenibacillus marchantiophytorum]
MNSETTLANSLVAKVQLGLPSAVAKLSAKMRFIDHIAPKLRKSGVIRPVRKMTPLSIRVSGIATAGKVIAAYGGMIYSAGAVRQDLYINEGSIYKTNLDSLVDIDEADDIDVVKKLKFIHITQMYDLLENMMNEEDLPQLVIVDTPLVLERADAPLELFHQLFSDYQTCKERIHTFWSSYKEKMYPYNPDGVRLVSISTKRFGSIFYGLSVLDGDHYILDEITKSEIHEEEDTFEKIKKVGVKKLLHGVLTRRSRTAAYEYSLLTNDNRLEPVSVRDLGLINFHFRAGMRTLPLLAEVIGKKEDWNTEMIDELASNLVSLVTIDQPQALPLPLWYADYALKPIKTGTIINYFKTQVREMVRSEEVEKVWKEEADLFEGDE